MNNYLGLQLLLHIVVFIWGFTGILGKLISVEENILVWYRMIIAAAGLYIFMLFSKKKLSIDSKSLWKFLGTGLIIALHWIFFYGSIKISNVSVAVTCMAVASFFTALLQPLLSRTKIVTYEILLGIGVIIGVFILMGVETQHKVGFIWGLISAFFAALFTVINGKFVKTHDSVVISFYEMMGGFAGLTIYNLMIGELNTEGLQLRENDFSWLLLLGIACTAFPFAASVWVMKQLSPYTVSISVNMEPIYTILLAIWIFGDSEKMSPGFYLGGAIILSTVIANALLKRFVTHKEKYLSKS